MSWLLVGLDWAGSGLDWAGLNCLWSGLVLFSWIGLVLGFIWLDCVGSGLELVARLFELIPIATIGTLWDALWLELYASLSLIVLNLPRSRSVSYRTASASVTNVKRY